MRTAGLVVFVIGVGIPLPSLSQELSNLPTAEVPPEALAGPVERPARAASRHPKLDSVLAEVAAEAAVSRERAIDKASASRIPSRANRVQVEVAMDPAAAASVLQLVLDLGGEITSLRSGATAYQVWLPPGRLITLADRPEVLYVRRPVLVVPLVTTEGLSPMNGTAWHTAGVRGAGVKIGIIDTGFLGYPGLLGSELPGAVTVRNFVDGETDPQVDGTSDHGTNVAELVHDVAPDAQLYFAKIATAPDFDEATDWLSDTAQVDVISTSVGFFNAGAGDGTGPLQAKVAGARSKGILWSTSAGNQRKRHWGDLWLDPNSNNFLNFNGTQEVNFYGPGDGTGFLINPGFNLTGFLRWSDWGGNPTEDYDLHFLRWNGSAWVIMASSTNPQTGLAGQQPVEQVTGTTTGSATFYGFAIERVSSNQSVNFNLHATGADIDEFRPPRSLIDMADAPSAITVAAVNTLTLGQEPFSSEGPTNGAGGTQTGGIDKPQLSGFSPVSTATGGTNGFNGTSSAAPHVAGAAALLRGFYPNLNADEIEQILAARGQDLGPTGFDFQTGEGQVHVGFTPSDADGDSVIDDGDTSSVSGDAACTNGNTTGCDDNCVLISNSNQATFDNDGLGDACDNCIQLANGPLVPDAGSNVQLDTDADGFGNMCDCDFDNDGFCTIGDFNLFLPDFQSGQDSGIGTDMDGDGFVSIGDFNLFLPGFTSGSPGPSAFAP